ncbi:uncharacterized protein [Chelonus insularis]|uniref:uncharacterized protein n=1 Tax=Chelonus insularis TaxID=460826 RepID=UPI00158AA5C8|nr:uncharacterized protein LOC118065509 [Chelonus insularis]
MDREPRILIIGAGAAGISAACHLIKNNFQNVTILEAKDRIGGRIFTKKFADNVVDLGAQWVHGEKKNVIHDLAAPYNLLESSHNLHDFEKHIFATSQGEIVPTEETSEVWRLFYAISDNAEKVLKNATESYGQYFTKEYFKAFSQSKFTSQKRAREFLEWMERFDSSIQGSDTWFEVSARGITEYAQCEGDLLLNWRDRGYHTALDLLMNKCKDISNGTYIQDKIRFLREVSNIDYTNPDEIIVSTSEGQKYSATNVIFTSSLGVLKDQHQSLFTPSLPDIKKSAIKGLGIGTVNKIFLEFSHRWWPEKCAGFGLIWSKEDKEDFLKSNPKENHWLAEVFEFLTVDYQPRVLAGWILGESSRFMETLTDDEVKKGMYQLLERFLGKSYNIPQPVNIFKVNNKSKWYSDKHFRGCYSFRSIESDQMNVYAHHLADPIVGKKGKPIILFAGEATHNHYYSTVHGAVETGFREANRLINYYRLVLVRRLRQVIWNPGKQVNIAVERIKKMSIETTKVVIIGAGIAGLAAAKTLEEKNFHDYLILEAQDYIGGRIRSIPWNNNWIEEGAQFLHGNQSQFAELCEQNDLLSEEQSYEAEGIFIRNDGLRVDKYLVEEIDNLIRDALEDCEKYAKLDNISPDMPKNINLLLRKSVLEHIMSKNESSSIKKVKEEIYDWIVKYLLIDNSCLTLDELSVKSWGKFQFVGGPEHLVFKEGYSSAIRMLTNNINKNCIRISSPVEKIEWHKQTKENDEKIVIVTLSNEKKILADCVIVTCSLGYLKENHEKMFIPSLPPHLTLTIDSLGFGLINKIFLDFGEAWWEPGVKGFQLIWHDNESDIEKLAPWTKDLSGFDVSQHHEAVLIGWIGGKGAYTIENLTDQEVGDECIYLLRYFFKNNYLPAPKRCKRTQWNKNKYMRGSYSHITTKCDEHHISPANLAKPVWAKIIQNNLVKNVPVLMFAGEATHDNFYSTTHGAYDSGQIQAKNFLRYHV